MKLFSKRGRAEKQVDIVKADRNLYIYQEVAKPGVVSYLNANGIRVRYITDSLQSMFMALIREKSPLRLIVIDYGLGKFKTLDEIQQMVGMVQEYSSDDKYKVSTIFTQSGAIRKFVEDKRLQNIDIKGYRGMGDVIRALNSYNENYVSDGATDVEGESEGKLLSYTYNRVKTAKDNLKVEKGNLHAIDVSLLDPTTGGETMSLERFKCKF